MAKMSTPLAELSLEELTKRKQRMSGILAGICVVYIALIVVSFVLIITKKKFNIQVMMPLIILPALIPSFILFGQLKTEIKKRQGV